MKNKLHVKRDDTVYVLSGKDRGKKGKILAVNTDKERVIVEGINIVVKHKKPKSMNQQGGIIKQEGFIHVSNVLLVCNKCSAPTKVQRKILEDNSKVRACKKCGEVIDIIREAK